MCLKPRLLPRIPDDTRTVAAQIYPSNHPMRRLGQEYADALCDQDFAHLYSSTGQPALLALALLALVTVLQANVTSLLNLVPSLFHFSFTGFCPAFVL